MQRCRWPPKQVRKDLTWLEVEEGCVELPYRHGLCAEPLEHLGAAVGDVGAEEVLEYVERLKRCERAHGRLR